MASAAEQLASSISLASFSKATELKKRLWFTLGALILFRLLSFVPVPGIDPVAMKALYQTQSGGILDVFNTFSGGALSRFSIVALGVMPYITASIVIQLGATLYGPWQALRKEGETGRKKLNQYTRYLTVMITLVQGYLAVRGLEAQTIRQGIQAVVMPGLLFEISGTVSLVGGTLFLMWIGEQITARGIGNGTSLIIMAGIVANLPSALATLLELGRTGALSPVFIVVFLVLAVAVVAFIVFMERAQRRVVIQYPKRQVGQRMFGGDSTHMPLKLNTSGVIPPIFASSILLVPATIVGFSGSSAEPGIMQTIGNLLAHGAPLYLITYAGMIIFFCYFYTAVVFNPEETADNLKKYGGFVPGIRPGKSTADYFDHILTRITTVGALYVAAVCLLPEILISKYGVPFYFGGTSLMIIVSVTMDTVTQIQSHLLAHQYEGLIKKARVKGRGR